MYFLKIIDILGRKIQVQYLYQKGYETSLVWELLNEEIK